MSKFHVKYCFLLMLCFFSLGEKLNAQNVDLVLEVGDELFEQKKYFGSILFYKKALEIDSSNVEVLYKYGKNLGLINNHKVASRYLLKAILLDKNKSFELLPYELAEAYRSSGEYRKARKYYNRALSPFRTNRKGYWYKRITQSKNAAAWASKRKNNTGATPSSLGKAVNSDFSEFGATIHDGRIFFAAMIADSVQNNNQVKDKDFYSQLYVKSLSDNKQATLLQLDQKAAQQVKNKHLANPSFYKGELYFSICDTNFNCEIWQGKLKGNLISELNKLNKNINKPQSNNTQASLAEINGESFLFFVSNRENGFGGLDIYKSKKESFGFGEAINLGSAINSPDNEITPYFDTKSQQLFFSSNWHNGFGGYDIFKSELKAKSFQAAENLGKGINSNYNEYYFQPHNKVATLTSNRTSNNVDKSSSCCNDLFEVNFKTKEAELPVEELTTDTVNEEILNKYLPLTLYFHNDSPDPNSRDTLTQKNYIDLAKAYTQLEATYQEKYTNQLPKREQEVIGNQLFNFFNQELKDGIDDLTSFSPLLLKELDKGNRVTLTVRGFASSLSAADYNLSLTLRRIQSLINFFRTTEGGRFIPYLDNKSATGGQLIINKLPYGEFAVKNNIDDKDIKAAIYSPQAISERKIELLAISSSSDRSVLNIEKKAKLKFQSEKYSIQVKKGVPIKRFFSFQNTGEGELKIYNVSSNLPQLRIEFPNTLASEERGTIKFELDTEGLSEEVEVKIIVVSNAKENLKPLNINIRFEN